ncbi:MAG: methylated-DNA--[protein]-cysteine S-methyltransferase [Microbacteriaceae bacterium]
MPPAQTPIHLLRVASPIGRIELTADDTHVVSLSMQHNGTLPHDHLDDSPNTVLHTAATQLEEYFSGRRHDFDVPVRLVGTDFQRAVWAELSTIPFGHVLSYGEVGLSTGRATAGRAVGGAVGANPVPIIVPCHRVLASNRRITGYSGGDGIPTKQWLLAHEGIAYAP